MSYPEPERTCDNRKLAGGRPSGGGPPTCRRVVRRAAQLLDGIGKNDLPQLELSLHVAFGRGQVSDEPIHGGQEGPDVWTGGAVLNRAPRLQREVAVVTGGLADRAAVRSGDIL